MCFAIRIRFSANRRPSSLFLQREGAEDVLEFWVDVQHHQNMCRAYFRGVRQSGRTIREDWPEYWDYARRRGSIYGDTTQARLADRAITPSEAGTDGYSLIGVSSRTDNRDSRVPMNVPYVIPRNERITRADLIASAQRIISLYLIPGADKEIYLPPALRADDSLYRLLNLPSPTSPAYEAEAPLIARVPDMFHAQKEYMFRAMEQDAFPRFLRAKGFGNLTPVGALARLFLGLLMLWATLSAAVAMIFLDIKPKSKRFFVSPRPFVRLVSHLSPPLAAFYSFHSFIPPSSNSSI
jgi:hypothetical protein